MSSQDMAALHIKLKGGSEGTSVMLQSTHTKNLIRNTIATMFDFLRPGPPTSRKLVIESSH